MRSINLTLIFCFALCSCATYIDRESYVSKRYEMFIFDDHNLLLDLANNRFTIDTEVYHRNAFAITIPKDIVYWQGGTDVIIEYASKQIIYIVPGRKEEIKKDSKWILRDATDDEVFNSLHNYFTNRGYSLDQLEKICDNLEKYRQNREYKVYTNGSTFVLLHNIKKKNYEHFVKGIKSLRYIDPCPTDDRDSADL